MSASRCPKRRDQFWEGQLSWESQKVPMRQLVLFLNRVTSRLAPRRNKEWIINNTAKSSANFKGLQVTVDLRPWWCYLWGILDWQQQMRWQTRMIQNLPQGWNRAEKEADMEAVQRRWGWCNWGERLVRISTRGFQALCSDTVNKVSHSWAFVRIFDMSSIWLFTRTEISSTHSHFTVTFPHVQPSTTVALKVT